MSQIAAPSARANHTAIWTGSFMIAWGGQDVASTVSTGGRYALGQSVDNDLDGFSECSGDCDDTSAAVYPGAPQVCDRRNNDCADPAWPALTGTNEVDADADGVSVCMGDCDDADAMVWAAPGEATNLTLLQIGGSTQLDWTAPPPGGGTYPRYYDTLRTSGTGDFTGGATCVETHDDTDTTSADPQAPAPGGVYFYLVRAVSGSCAGPAGYDSLGDVRAARSCP
jgi:hypothetical protein